MTLLLRCQDRYQAQVGSRAAAAYLNCMLGRLFGAKQPITFFTDLYDNSDDLDWCVLMLHATAVTGS